MRNGIMRGRSCRRCSTKGLRILRQTCFASWSGGFRSLLIPIDGAVKPLEAATHPDQMDTDPALIRTAILRDLSLAARHQVDQVDEGRRPLLAVGFLPDKDR